MERNENPLGLKLFSAECGKGKFDFLQVPLQLLFEPAFKALDFGSIILYSLILRRINLSAENYKDFSDDNGNLYIIYTIDQICEHLNCSNKTAINALNKLEKVGLIKKARQGLTKPNIIYVYDFSTVHFKKCKNYTSESVDTTFQEMKILHSNYKDNNYIDYNEIYNKNDGWIDRNSIEKIVKNNIAYDSIINHPIKGNNYYRADIIDEICDIIIDTLCSNKLTFPIGGANLPARNVKDVLLKLNYFHIYAFLERINKTYTEKPHMRDYVLTALYDIVTTENISSLSSAKADGTIP